MFVFLRLLLLGFTLFSSVTFATETRIKIAVVDTGIVPGVLKDYLCSEGHKDFTGEGLDDFQGHGTNIAGLIAKKINPKTHCLLILKYYGMYHFGNGYNTIKAFSLAIALDAKYINYSSGGASYSHTEFLVLSEALSRGIRVAVAAGNEATNLTETCNYFPACYRFAYPGFYVVGALNGRKRAWFSNYGALVNAWEQGTDQEALNIRMSGSSQATANWTGKIAAEGL